MKRVRFKRTGDWQSIPALKNMKQSVANILLENMLFIARVAHIVVHNFPSKLTFGNIFLENAYFLSEIEFFSFLPLNSLRVKSELIGIAQSDTEDYSALVDSRLVTIFQCSG